MKLCQSRFNSQCKLSQQDLRDISEEIIETYAPHDNHQPELVLMPVDPVNLYAYWNLPKNETDNETNRKAPPIDKQFALRIYTIPELSESASNIKLSFEVKVDGLNNQQKVQLPIAASAYSAVIGEINADNHFNALASSKAIHVPRDNPAPERQPGKLHVQSQDEQIQELHLANNHAHQRQDFCTEDQAFNQTIHASQTQENSIIAETKTDQINPDTIVLNNFNNYGYDLQIHSGNIELEADILLPKQNSRLQVISPTSSTINKYSSELRHPL